MKLKINGDWYDQFNDITVNYSLDSVASTFAFSGRFDLKNPDHKILFKPFSFYDCLIYDNDNKLKLTGEIIGHSFNSKEAKEMVVFSGYSKGGVLEDCSIPVESYPLESIGRSLKDITERLLKYFDLKLIIDNSVINDCNLIYQKTVGEPTGSVKEYLSKLATQRNVVMSHNEKGDIIYFRPDTKAESKYFFNSENTLNMSLDVQGQGMHSEISILKQPSKGGGSASYSDKISNPLILKKRFITQTVSSGEDGETAKGAKSFLAEELKSIKISFSLNYILDLKIGDIVEVENEEIFIFKRQRFIIISVSESETSSSGTMSISLVLPESFTGDIPKNIFEL